MTLSSYTHRRKRRLGSVARALPVHGRDQMGVQVPFSSVGRRALDRGRAGVCEYLEGNLIAFDARTGRDLWHLQTGSEIYASPIAYAVRGRQYVVTASGSALFAVALPESRLAKEAAATR